MLKIDLINKHWNSFSDSVMSVNFLGYIDFEDRLFLTAFAIVTFLQDRIYKEFSLREFLYKIFLPEAKGNFSLIIKIQDTCILICDFSRTFPLYVIYEESVFTVSDHIGQLRFLKEPDQLAIEQFLLSGLVTGHDTVFKNVKGLQAGEMAIIKFSEINYYRYYTLKPDPLRLENLPDKTAKYLEMDNLFLAIFTRMIKSCPDVNNWVVPLSGGHDSRLIINYLYRLGCSNVICFTYGVTSSKEAEISRLAAKAVGYRWYFIEYTANDWEKMNEIGLLDKYVNYSFNGCCLPHTQDLLAIYKLKGMSVINEKDVVVPGHTAFTEAESVLIKTLTSERKSLKYVYDKYFTLFNCNNRFNKFEPVLRSLLNDEARNINSFPEYFNWQERQSKFINNSGRVYEFFGLEWRMPFWEKCVIDFWQSINFDDRICRSILFSACRERLLSDELKKVPFIDKFSKPKAPGMRIINIIPQRLRSSCARIFDRKPVIAEGTNLIFAEKTTSVGNIAGPLNLYPPNIRKLIRNIAPRRPYQVNTNTLMAIFTLHNEVFNAAKDSIE